MLMCDVLNDCCRVFGGLLELELDAAKQTLYQLIE
jgi:hypothetical protein